MIIRNGKLTTWTDSLENLLLAANDAAFGRMRNEVVELTSERHSVTVTVEAGSANTESKELADIALAQGYWIKSDGFDGWEIMLNWSHDPSNPPDNHAIHTRPAPMAGITAATMGQRGGASTSDAKVAAARENGKRGGRPRKEAK